MGERLIHNELEKQAYWRPSKVAMLFEEAEYTYSEFDARVNRVANALIDRGITDGDRLLAHGRDHVDWHTLFYACSKTGATFCPVSRFQSRENLEFITRTLDPEYVFYTDDDEVVERLSTIHDATPDATFVSLDQGEQDPTLDELTTGYDRDRPPVAERQDPDSVHNVFWTSGTTGRPKGVVRTHRSSLHFADNLVNDLPFRAWNRRVTTNSMMLIDAYFHYGIPTVMTGGTNVMLRSFSAERLYDAVTMYDVNSLHLGFTLSRLVLEYLDERDETLSLRYLSAVIPSANAARRLWDHTDRLYHLYGTTEIGLPLVTEIEPPFDDRPSLGKPGVGAEVRVASDDEEEVPSDPPSIGDVGELVCRGETTMTRYLDPETQRTQVTDGWIRPGDVVRVNENRDVVFLGRTDDRIRSGGINVYPGDVEDALEDHPAVKNTVVTGVPDDTWGERVCALVVTDATDTERLEDDLDDHCLASDALADQMRPRGYAFVASNDEIPTGALGKPDRSGVAEEYFEST